jgi:DNA-binding MarR family transcriptional regulator
MKEIYFRSVVMIENLHRLFLEVLESTIQDMKIMDINSVQALMLYNIGHDQVAVGELTGRGYYLGSNVSYNLGKMVKNGYVNQESNPHDLRSSRVKLSAKGMELYDKLDKMFLLHGKDLVQSGITDKEFQGIIQTLGHFENFWIRQKNL